VCPKGKNRGPIQLKSGEYEPSAGLQGTDQPNSAGNQLGPGENSPCEVVFLQTLKEVLWLLMLIKLDFLER
jgi:hypothetical protein